MMLPRSWPQDWEWFSRLRLEGGYHCGAASGAPPVRLVAWNCCPGPIEAKLQAVRSLRADIVVVPDDPKVERRPQAIWIGANPRKGLAVFAAPPWRLEPIDVSPVRLPRYFLPVRVTGPETFTLWGVWAHTFEADKYVRGTHRALDECDD